MIKNKIDTFLWITIIFLGSCSQNKVFSQENDILTIATVQDLVNGDLICYATLIDDNGQESTMGASFEICEKPDQYLNKKVKLTYELANINDCESNEPCGKTRQELIIIEMETIE
ncbi:hypothetical protein [Geminocystis sp. NIES-3709]|uniref:hypothetical protein n=1 Tax=Geminocystis sp. NIES-3709 TaxID=1617448 RepID=UPI0005FC592A|nr:hypothetical protein [Geminocystis sp. NIES-3709]BAQ63886.1 hypothetical protein GM3709_651 [Geminocystis sp. NIES-3709]